jgi:aminopeptidase S
MAWVDRRLRGLLIVVLIAGVAVAAAAGRSGPDRDAPPGAASATAERAPAAGTTAERAAAAGATPGHAPTAGATPAPAPAAALGPADVTPHLDALARVARAHGGNRAAGTRGDAGTRAYVVARLRAAGWRVREQVVSFRARRRPRDSDGRAPAAAPRRQRTANVIAERGTGRRVVMAGAHLDSVADGPGINDDGSGIAALLALAERGVADVPPGVGVRLGFWGAEEHGLYGSRAYVRGLDARARRAHGAYLNLDMVGTPRGRFAVYGSDVAPRRALRRGLRARGRSRIAFEQLGGGSDHASFASAGIDVGGIFTGLDACYHRACDDRGNVDPERIADAAAATASALAELARAIS